MKTTALILFLISLTSGIAAAPTVDDHTPPEPVVEIAQTPRPVVEIAGTPEQIALAEKAVARFDAAGLDLPSLAITFHDHRGGCRGNNGVFRMMGGRGEVEVCRPTMFLLLHELAHAWEAHTMDDTMRNRVEGYWKVDNWNDHSQSANDRGTEKVANAVAFALDDPPELPNETMRRNLCTYQMVTSNDVGAGIELACPALSDQDPR
ncbi:MAG: hypothetical protein ACR2P0_10370 [Acidimicrobiales bacterium]